MHNYTPHFNYYFHVKRLESVFNVSTYAFNNCQRAQLRAEEGEGLVSRLVYYASELWHSILYVLSYASHT